MIRAALIIFFLGLALASYRADNFIDLWLTADQQGSFFYQQEEYVSAAQRYEEIYNKGLSYYAAQDFYNAIASLQSIETPEAFLATGNAFAQLNQLQESIDAYNEALALKPDYEAAKFNLNWVSGLKILDEKEYEDVGGTGGQLSANEFVVDDKADDAVGEMNEQEMRAQGLSDKQMQDMWMRRVQTTPGDFLAYKFAYQSQQKEQP